MKSIAKKIAMILIIVMIVNCFTGCAEIILVPMQIIAYTLVGTLIVGGVIAIIVGIYGGVKINKRGPRKTNPYLYENNTLNTTINSLSKEEIDSLTNAFYSLPDKELDLFIDKLGSLSEKESISLMNSINTFSVQELAAIVETFNSISETERSTSIESANSLPKTVPMAYVVRNIEVDVSGEKASVGQRIRY